MIFALVVVNIVNNKQISAFTFVYLLFYYHFWGLLSACYCKLPEGVPKLANVVT